MQEREITVNSRMTRVEVRRIIVAWAEQRGAVVKPMGRLVRPYKSRGDGVHWHIGGLRPGMGTVEVTFSPSAGTITVLVHDNRRGSWAGGAFEDLAREIKKLAG